jgi:hypothetical protein
VYNGGGWINIANGGDVVDGSKYSTSKNPSTGLYYRLHIMKVGLSDIKKYRCQGITDERIKIFYLELNLLGRCIT